MTKRRRADAQAAIGEVSIAVDERVANEDFHHGALDWIRTHQSLHTHVLPQDALALADDDGVVRIDGFVVRGTAARTGGIAGLWALLFGSILVLANLPGFTREMKAFTERAGGWLLLAGAGCFVVAEIMRRRQRTRVLLELRPASTGAVTQEAVAALVKAAGRAHPWIVAEADFDPQAIVAANARAVRCFIRKGEAYDEIDLGITMHDEAVPPEPSPEMIPASRASS